MNSQPDLTGDALIDEVRLRRRLLLEEHGNDLARLLEAIQRLQAEHPERLVDDRRRRAAGR